MSTHLRIKGTVYHARLKIPVDIRESFLDKHGKPKHEFSQSLETSRKPEATQRAAIVVSYWLKEIHEARGRAAGTPEDLSATAWAMKWLEDLKQSNPQAPDDPDDVRIEAAVIDLDKQVTAGHMTVPEARKALRVARGTEVLLQTHAEAFLETYEGKSRSSLRGSLKHFLKVFKTPEDITPEAIRDWWQGMATHLAAKTMGVVLSTSRSFMKFLKDKNLVKASSIGLLKAEDLKVPRTATKSVPYQPWTVDQCNDLLGRAKLVKGSSNLTLLMTIGMYTGARIEEVCSIKREDVHLKDGWMLICGTKTEAAEDREVPLHPVLKKAVEATLKSHKDEWLIPGLPMTKHGDRANAIGKQFGRLKAAAGFTTRSKCFHSYRKTLVTQMEQRGIPEGVVADIVGHEKNTITYGVYSNGSSMDQKKEAIASIKF